MNLPIVIINQQNVEHTFIHLNVLQFNRRLLSLQLEGLTTTVLVDPHTKGILYLKNRANGIS